VHGVHGNELAYRSIGTFSNLCQTIAHHLLSIHEPNAAAQARPEAGAQRTLLDVACSRLFGAGWAPRLTVGHVLSPRPWCPACAAAPATPGARPSPRGGPLHRQPLRGGTRFASHRRRAHVPHHPWGRPAGHTPGRTALARPQGGPCRGRSRQPCPPGTLHSLPPVDHACGLPHAPRRRAATHATPGGLWSCGAWLPHHRAGEGPAHSMPSGAHERGATVSGVPQMGAAWSGTPAASRAGKRADHPAASSPPSGMGQAPEAVCPGRTGRCRHSAPPTGPLGVCSPGAAPNAGRQAPPIAAATSSG